MKSIKDKKLLIYGTGAVGGYYGGALVKAGYDVTFVARGKTYAVLRENGLTLITDGKKEIIPINVNAIHELPQQERFDYIFICVKSKDTKVAAEQIKNNVGPSTSVLSFQNGVDNEEIIGGIVGIDKVIGANVYVASMQMEPGVIDQFGYNAVVIGELDRKQSKRVSELKNILESAGILCTIPADIMAELWNKLVWNASFNPVSVVTGETVDKILENKELFELVRNIMIEVRDVAIAHGINIRKDTVEFNLERSKGVNKRTMDGAQNFIGFKTSMLQDFERGKPLEIEELAGVVIRKAKEKNIPVPNIKKVYNEVKQKTIKTKV